ncbi:MAG: hypothetical protein AB1413_12305 [Thermodesulfobacteriota bacterium]
MQRIGTPSGLFSAGNPATNTKGTVVTDAWLNAVQEELAGILEGFGVVLTPADSGQLIDALLANLANIIGNASNVFRVAQAVGNSDAVPLAQALQLIAAGDPESTLTDQATITWDWATQPNAKITLGGNRTLAGISNLPAGGYAALRVAQDATGGRVLSFASSYKGMLNYTQSTGANEADWLLFRGLDGTNCELIGYPTGVNA